MRLELPQAIPPRDLMNASRSKGPERTRRSTAALALQRLVVQEVLVVFRAICFEIINSISHRIAIVQIVVELFAEQPSVKSEHIPVGWLVKMGAVEPRNANTATFDLCHETYDKRDRNPFGKAKFHLDDEILVDWNGKESGEAFGHFGSVSLRQWQWSSRRPEWEEREARLACGHGWRGSW